MPERADYERARRQLQDLGWSRMKPRERAAVFAALDRAIAAETTKDWMLDRKEQAHG